MKSKLFSVILLASMALSLLPVSPVLSAPATAPTMLDVSYDIEFFTEDFLVQPGEGYMYHVEYVPYLNEGDDPITVEPYVGSPEYPYGAFRCNGGGCPTDYVYHYRDTEFDGVQGTGTKITVVGPILHDNPGDGRRTQILVNGTVVYECPEGWVAPTCEYTLQEGESGLVAVHFQDSVAIRELELTPPPPEVPVCLSATGSPPEGEITYTFRINEVSVSDPGGQITGYTVRLDGNEESVTDPIGWETLITEIGTHTIEVGLTTAVSGTLYYEACKMTTVATELPVGAEPAIYPGCTASVDGLGKVTVINPTPHEVKVRLDELTAEPIVGTVPASDGQPSEKSWVGEEILYGTTEVAYAIEYVDGRGDSQTLEGTLNVGPCADKPEGENGCWLDRAELDLADTWHIGARITIATDGTPVRFWSASGEQETRTYEAGEHLVTWSYQVSWPMFDSGRIEIPAGSGVAAGDCEWKGTVPYDPHRNLELVKDRHGVENDPVVIMTGQATGAPGNDNIVRHLQVWFRPDGASEREMYNITDIILPHEGNASWGAGQTYQFYFPYKFTPIHGEKKSWNLSTAALEGNDPNSIFQAGPAYEVALGDESYLVFDQGRFGFNLPQDFSGIGRMYVYVWDDWTISDIDNVKDRGDARRDVKCTVFVVVERGEDPMSEEVLNKYDPDLLRKDPFKPLGENDEGGWHIPTPPMPDYPMPRNYLATKQPADRYPFQRWEGENYGDEGVGLSELGPAPELFAQETVPGDVGTLTFLRNGVEVGSLIIVEAQLDANGKIVSALAEGTALVHNGRFYLSAAEALMAAGTEVVVNESTSGESRRSDWHVPSESDSVTYNESMGEQNDRPDIVVVTGDWASFEMFELLD
ncbi:hypothetical protein KKB83_04810 [Patescibacteria group bacterium]|nr:hypothetical protein [Patescibacteria group bacterium]